MLDRVGLRYVTVLHQLPTVTGRLLVLVVTMIPLVGRTLLLFVENWDTLMYNHQYYKTRNLTNIHYYINHSVISLSVPHSHPSYLSLSLSLAHCFSHNSYLSLSLSLALCFSHNSYLSLSPCLAHCFSITPISLSLSLSSSLLLHNSYLSLSPCLAHCFSHNSSLSLSLSSSLLLS